MTLTLSHPQISIVSDKPLILHGTSVEAVSMLLKDGNLPPSTKEGLEGQFYFVPVSRNFERSPYNIPLRQRKYTKSQAISTAKYYASLSAMEFFLENQLGFLPEWFYDVPHTKTNLRAWLEYDKKVTLSPQKIKSLVNNLLNRKGVIIEPDERIFEFPYVQGGDPSYLSFTIPNGIPLSHVGRIQPLGEIERNSLMSLV